MRTGTREKRERRNREPLERFSHTRQDIAESVSPLVDNTASVLVDVVHILLCWLDLLGSGGSTDLNQGLERWGDGKGVETVVRTELSLETRLGAG